MRRLDDVTGEPIEPRDVLGDDELAQLRRARANRPGKRVAAVTGRRHADLFDANHDQEKDR